jgi:hypothetical protein
MPIHDISFTIQEKILLSKDMTFDIKSDGTKLGTVLISKGNIEWLPAGNSVNKRSLSWEAFAALMEGQGREAKVKKAA